MSDIRFPWREIMAFGFGQLHIGSDVFWHMTLRELTAATFPRGSAGRSAISRDSFSELQMLYPDEETRDG